MAGGFTLDFEERTGLGRHWVRYMWHGQGVHKQAKARCQERVWNILGVLGTRSAKTEQKFYF